MIMHSLEQLVRILEKNRKKPLVLVGGTYDLLHVGHARYLEECRRWGNQLIVHIVGDQKVKERKGILRPINTEQDRAELVSNLKPVEEVFIYNGCTYSDEVIQAVKPDVLVLSGEKEEEHRYWKRILEERYHFLRVEIIPVQTTSSSSQKEFQRRGINLLERFHRISGLSRDLYYTPEMLDFEFAGTRAEILRSVSQEIQRIFSPPEISEDVIVYGSVAYGGVVDSSDVDLIGINRRNPKNRKYFFRIRNGQEIIPVSVRVDNGIDYYHTRFRYRPFPAVPEEFINNNFPKCWGFIPSDVFSKDSLLNRLAQIDAIECLAAIAQVLFYERGGKEVMVTPEIVTDKLKEEFMKTRRRGLFANRRWERGLKGNCQKTMEVALRYCNFWADEIDEHKFKIVKTNGLTARSRVYSPSYALRHSLSPSFLAYQIDKIRYSGIIPSLFPPTPSEILSTHSMESSQ